MPLRNADGDVVPCSEELRSHSMKKPWEQRTRTYTGGRLYRYCKVHGKWKPETHACFHNERAPKRAQIDFPAIQTFKPHWDEHIGRKTHGGLPVLVRSRKQKKELLKVNGLIEVG